MSRPRIYDGPCSNGGCDSPARSRGLCLRCYYRAWRERNPDTRRQHGSEERRRAWRAANRDRFMAQHRAQGQRARARDRVRRGLAADPTPRQRAPRPRVVPEPIADLHLGHELFSLARQLVPDLDVEKTDRIVFREEMDRQDCRSEVVLAVLESRDPRHAIRVYLTAARTWIRSTVSLDTPAIQEVLR